MKKKQHVRPEVTVYTDGACSGNPGPGGWAAVLRYGDYEREISRTFEMRSPKPYFALTSFAAKIRAVLNTR